MKAFHNIFGTLKGVRENCAKGVIFISKAVGIGVLISGMLLFGVPIDSNVKAQSSGQLPPPPVPMINWLTGNLVGATSVMDWSYYGSSPNAHPFDMSVDHTVAPVWSGDCYYWSDTNGNSHHTDWEQWSQRLEYSQWGTFRVRIERAGHPDHYSGISWAEATWYAYLINNSTKPQTRVTVRDSEGNSYEVDIYINP